MTDPYDKDDSSKAERAAGTKLRPSTIGRHPQLNRPTPKNAELLSYRLENMKTSRNQCTVSNPDPTSSALRSQPRWVPVPVVHPVKCTECFYGTSLRNARNMYKHLRTQHAYDEKAIAQFKAEHVTTQRPHPPRAVVNDGDEQSSDAHHHHCSNKDLIKDPLEGTMNFSSNGDFEDWFEKISHETCTSFTVNWKSVSKRKVVLMFCCIGTHSRKNKAETKQTNHKNRARNCCTFAKVKKFQTGEVIVQYFIGHTVDPSESSLTKGEKLLMKSIMEDGTLSNKQVAKKIKLLEKHPNSRLNFIDTSQVCAFRRSWKLDKSRISTRDFESLRLRTAEDGAAEGIMRFNSEVHRFAEKMLKEEQIDIIEVDDYFIIKKQDRLDVQIHPWSVCSCDQENNNHCLDCDCCPYTTSCTCYHQLAGVACWHQHVINMKFEFNRLCSKESRGNIDADEVENCYVEEEMDTFADEVENIYVEEEMNTTTDEVDWSVAQNLEQLQRRFLLYTNELKRNVDNVSARDALQDICEMVRKKLSLSIPHFTLDIHPRKEQAGLAQNHTPIRKDDKIFSQSQKRPRQEEDGAEPSYR